MYIQARRKWGAGGALALPVFGQTVNPISTRGDNYARHSNPSPPGLSDLEIVSTEKNYGQTWGIKWTGPCDILAKKKQLSFYEGLRPMTDPIKEGL